MSHPPNRTIVYINAHPLRGAEIASYADTLRNHGFEVIDGSGSTRSTQIDFLNIAKADVMLFLASGADISHHIKLGWAAASGLLLISIGSSQMIAPAIRETVFLHCETFADLADNRFKKLKYARYKKPTRKRK